MEILVGEVGVGSSTSSDHNGQTIHHRQSSIHVSRDIVEGCEVEPLLCNLYCVSDMILVVPSSSDEEFFVHTISMPRSIFIRLYKCPCWPHGCRADRSHRKKTRADERGDEGVSFGQDCL